MTFYSSSHWDVTERGGLLSLVCGVLQQCILSVRIRRSGGTFLNMCGDQDFMDYDECADARRVHPAGRPNLKRQKVDVS